MQLTEAATLDRKSGGADLSRRAVEGSAVPRTFPGNVFDSASLTIVTPRSAAQWRDLRRHERRLDAVMSYLLHPTTWPSWRGLNTRWGSHVSTFVLT
jgi:hypothetical protein